MTTAVVTDGELGLGPHRERRAPEPFELGIAQMWSGHDRHSGGNDSSYPTTQDLHFAGRLQFYDKPDGELLHLANWVECIRDRSKTPTAPAESGVSAATAAHLANQSARSGQVAKWKG